MLDQFFFFCLFCFGLAGLEHGAIHGPLLRVELLHAAQSVVAACPSHSHYELGLHGALV